VPAKRRLTREESKARTRQELLRAAQRLFLRNGFVATSLSDIAEEAGLTKGAVYSNFESKEDLFLALLAGDGERRYATHEELAPSADAWADKLAGVHPNRRNVALFLEMNAFALRNERTRAGAAEHNRSFFEELGNGLREALDAADADPETLGLLAQSLYVGLMMHVSFLGEADPELFASAYEMLAALAKSPTRSA
jgi:AcrR family transcriptional regulator